MLYWQGACINRSQINFRSRNLINSIPSHPIFSHSSNLVPTRGKSAPISTFKTPFEARDCDPMSVPVLDLDSDEVGVPRQGRVGLVEFASVRAHANMLVYSDRTEA